MYTIITYIITTYLKVADSCLQVGTPIDQVVASVY